MVVSKDILMETRIIIVADECGTKELDIFRLSKDSKVFCYILDPNRCGVTVYCLCSHKEN